MSTPSQFPLFRVSVICTGNICRSPMAEVVFRHQIATDDFLANRVEVTSAGTANWHVGRPMDWRARKALDQAGLSEDAEPAVFANAEYLNAHDLIIVMTRDHVHEVNSRLTNRASRVMMLRNLQEPGMNLDVADPYYGDLADFAACIELFRESGRYLTSALRQQLGAETREV